MRSCVVVSILMTVLAVQARAQTESTFIYGIHDADPMPQAYLDRLNAAGVTGFVTATVAIGRDPTDMSGADFRPIANQGHTVICRLNYGYFPTGSLPPRNTTPTSPSAARTSSPTARAARSGTSATR